MPREFDNLSSGKIKKKFRELSRKYHPDKMQGNNTSERFIQIKNAYEILNDPEKRLAYDVYGKVDFSQDDRMKQMVEQRFKNKSEQDAQYETYKKAQNSAIVFQEVGPYYLTWTMLSIYRVDRGSTSYLLLFLIGLAVVFEVNVRQKYGTGQFEYFFSIID
jgi:curved DNA-binding protein CbpA